MEIITEMAGKLVFDRNIQFGKGMGNIAEMFVFSNPPSVVRAVYDLLVKRKHLCETDLELAVMTVIAIGGRSGAALEEVFPEFKNANPRHVF